jgi:hypothetical protein
LLFIISLVKVKVVVLGCQKVLLHKPLEFMKYNLVVGYFDLALGVTGVELGAAKVLIVAFVPLAL